MFENQSYFQPASKLSGLLWRRDGKSKESFQQCLWNLNICIKKVDAKCLLAEMTLVMMSLPLACFLQCLFTCVLFTASCSLAEIWQLSWLGATGKLEVEFKFQRCSCKLSLLFLPAARAPQQLAHRLSYCIKLACIADTLNLL